MQIPPAKIAGVFSLERLGENRFLAGLSEDRSSVLVKLASRHAQEKAVVKASVIYRTAAQLRSRNRLNR